MRVARGGSAAAGTKAAAAICGQRRKSTVPHLGPDTLAVGLFGVSGAATTPTAHILCLAEAVAMLHLKLVIFETDHFHH